MENKYKLNDIKQEDLELAEIASKFGYGLYQKAKKKFPKNTDEDFNKIMNSLENAIIYFIANEVADEYIDSLCDSMCQSIRNNCQRLKKHKEINDDEFLFSKELRDRMSKFNDMNINDALKMPEFYESLFDHAKLDQNERNEIWDHVGLPNLKK